MFQSYALYPTMTARQNMTFGMESRRVPKTEMDAAIKRVSALLQIEPLLNRKPGEAGASGSGGDGRARAIPSSSQPTSRSRIRQDAKLRADMRGLEIKKLHLRGRDDGLRHLRSDRGDDAADIVVGASWPDQQFDELQVVYDHRHYVRRRIEVALTNFYSKNDEDHGAPAASTKARGEKRAIAAGWPRCPRSGPRTAGWCLASVPSTSFATPKA